jgi:hypothetical protein
MKKSNDRPHDAPQKLELGSVVVSNAAALALSRAEIITATERHGSLDFGDLDKEDLELNRAALRGNGRILSQFNSDRGGTFFVVTEASRSRTLILLPIDYRPGVQFAVVR